MIETQRRYCPACEKFLPFSEFYDDPRGRDGLTRRCRTCHSLKSYASRKKKIEKFSRSERHEYNREISLWKAYRLTLEEFNSMKVAQGNRCAICGKTETAVRSGRVSELAVDHDHETGQIRSLLCGSCNCAIGLLQDDPELMRAAALYIERWAALNSNKEAS